MEAQSLMGLEVLLLAVMALGMALRGEGLILVAEELLLLKEVNIVTSGVEKISSQAPLKGNATIPSYQNHSARKTRLKLFIQHEKKGTLRPSDVYIFTTTNIKISLEFSPWKLGGKAQFPLISDVGNRNFSFLLVFSEKTSSSCKVYSSNTIGNLKIR